MIGGSPGSLRVLAILAGWSLRRRWNRIRAVAWSRRRKKGNERGPTARKGGRSMIGLAVMGVLFVGQAFGMSYNYTYVIVRQVEREYGAEDERPKFESFGSRVWVKRAPVAAVLRPFAVLFTLLLVAILLLALGTANAELSQAGWSMEWLFTFPVPTRGLLMAKVGEYGLTSIFTWFTVFPLSTTIFWNAGWQAWGILLGVIATLLVAFSIASARVLIETYLRKRLALHRVKNIQALCTLGGMVFVFTVFGLLARGKPPDALFRVADAIGGVLLYLPTGAILQIADSAGRGIVLLAWSLVTVGLCLAAAETLLSDGLVAAGGAYQGERRPSRKRTSGVGGILGKDLHLLLRDRNFLMQTVFLPIIIVGFQLVVNPALTGSGSSRTMAVLAFGIGAYVLAFGGFSVLTAERNALWLLFTFPRRLDRLFRRKTFLWAVLAFAYAVTILAIGWRPRGSMTAIEWAAPAFALLGVTLHAYLAGAMGVLGTDPFETEIHKKVRPEWSLLYMLVAANYGMTLATGEFWSVLVVHVVLAFLVIAMWNRVEARLPYLLDPSAQPVRRIDASDGLLATFLFFCLQQVIVIAAVSLGAPRSFATTGAYGIAGLLTLLAVLYSFWRLHVAHVVRDLGLRFPHAGKLGLGVLVGWAVSLVAGAYLDMVPAAREAAESGREYLAAHPDWSTAYFVLAVLLAPVIEEFLFRGLLFRGMQRSMRTPFAVAGSAVLFAVMHPPVSVVPVFVLGIATALVFSATRLIWAAVAVHMVYNYFVLMA